MKRSVYNFLLKSFEANIVVIDQILDFSQCQVGGQSVVECTGTNSLVSGMWTFLFGLVLFV